jgi:catechol 2,3-dioxygenase-like lactoylglutathione lyase family enzyme
MRVNHLDHLVLTVEDIQASIAFYTRVLGMRETTFAGGRKGLVFGQSKIKVRRVVHTHGARTRGRRAAGGMEGNHVTELPGIATLGLASWPGRRAPVRSLRSYRTTF